MTVTFIATRMLVGDRLKYLGLIAGLSFASFLITQQASIFAGYSARTLAWLKDTPHADLWVMDPQTEFTQDDKPVHRNMVQRIRGISGVGWAVPMYKGYLKLRLPDGALKQVRVIGLDDESLIGGPPEMVQGDLSSLRQDRGVLVDQAEVDATLSVREGESTRPLRVGDEVSINEYQASVVGVYRRAKEFFWEPLVYTTFSRALQMAPAERKMVGYVLVRLAPSADISAVAKEIESRTGLRAYTREEFEDLTLWYTLEKTGILINFGITIGLGFVIGVLIAGQLLYNFVIDNLRFFGALKAMGATNTTIAGMVLLQSFIAGAFGFGIGVGIAGASGFFLGDGGLAYRMTWHIPLFGAVSIVGCCLFAGILSAQRVFRLDPAIVFRGG